MTYLLAVIASRPSTRAPGTTAARVGVWRRFLRWVTHLTPPATVPPPPSSRGPALTTCPGPQHFRPWLASLLRKGVRPRTLITYTSHLSVGARRLRWSCRTRLQDARESLKRLLPLFPTKQANPALPSDAWAAFRREPRGRGLLAATLFGTMGRFSDLVRAPARNYVFPSSPPGIVHIRYGLTKTAQKGSTRCVVVSLPPPVWRALRSLVADTPAWRHPFARIRYSAFYAFCRALRPAGQPHLSAHSWRRGGIQLALDRGVSERAVMALTGHRSVSTLMGYADRISRKRTAAMLSASSSVWA